MNVTVSRPFNHIIFIVLPSVIIKLFCFIVDIAVPLSPLCALGLFQQIGSYQST